MGLFNKNKELKDNEFKLTLEQFWCPNCDIKHYFNIDDNVGDFSKCPMCNSECKKVRKFETTVNKFNEY